MWKIRNGKYDFDVASTEGKNLLRICRRLEDFFKFKNNFTGKCYIYFVLALFSFTFIFAFIFNIYFGFEMWNLLSMKRVTFVGQINLLTWWWGKTVKNNKMNVGVNSFVPNAHFLYPLKTLFLGGRERAHWEKSLQVYKIVDRHVFYVPVSISQRKNTRQRCEISSKLTIKTPGRCNRVFTVNFEHISHLCLLYLGR